MPSIVVPSDLSFSMSSLTLPFEWSSRLAVGSSRRRSRGCLTMARATLSLSFSPPEKVLA